MNNVLKHEVAAEMGPRFVVGGIGEVLWDLLPTGPKIGGAPANFAYHAQSLGAEARLISRVGSDELGVRLLHHLRGLGVQTEGIGVDSAHPTGTAAVRILADGQHQFTITDDVAWDYLSADSGAFSLLADAHAVCFGTLAQRSEQSRGAICKMLASIPTSALRVLDVNLRQSHYSTELLHKSLRLANVIKLSDSELPIVADVLGIRGSVIHQIETIVRRYGLRMLAYTQGSKGSILYDGQSWEENTGQAVQVLDTIGAGDSFTACLILGLLAGWELRRISDLANAVASYVCTCDGATPQMPPHLRAHFGISATTNCYV